MWDRIVPRLARHFTVIAPDLRGYRDAWKPDGVAQYSFRAMGADICALMDHLGYRRFALAGHDRGARVAHRLCLDKPDRITRVCLMDIVPTHTILSQLRQDVAAAYYHWFFLAQPWPLPETLIGHDPVAYFRTCLLGWGGANLSDFDANQMRAYEAAWKDPATVRAMCDDYRATLVHDMADDEADLGTRITCPALILYGAQGAMARLYDVADTWADKCTDIQARAIAGGHFFPDTNPVETAEALLSFLGRRTAVGLA
jgi:haloacetate dehalogenase